MMKSDIAQLKRRGFIEQRDLDTISDCSNAKLVSLIDSSSACERTAAVKLLAQATAKDDSAFIHLLLRRLVIEKCLYTRLEIGNALEKGGITTAKMLTGYLGRIGTNQHSTVPELSSKKKGYPLPRDIIARILGRMDPSILSVLFTALDCADERKIAEVIDAVGYMIFYHPQLAVRDNFDKITAVMRRYPENPLIIWKSITCLSAFPIRVCAEFLERFISETDNSALKNEAFRSISIIKPKCSPSV